MNVSKKQENTKAGIQRVKNIKVTAQDAKNHSDKKPAGSPSTNAKSSDVKPVGPAPKTTEQDLDNLSSKAKGKRKATEMEGPDASETLPAKPRQNIRKLVPPRPFPTVPTSVSATGPRSAHKEGKNYICLTRKTPLGAYLRRCKDVILKDGYGLQKSD